MPVGTHRTYVTYRDGTQADAHQADRSVKSVVNGTSCQSSAHGDERIQTTWIFWIILIIGQNFVSARGLFRENGLHEKNFYQFTATCPTIKQNENTAETKKGLRLQLSIFLLVELICSRGQQYDHWWISEKLGLRPFACAWVTIPDSRYKYSRFY